MNRLIFRAVALLTLIAALLSTASCADAPTPAGTGTLPESDAADTAADTLPESDEIIIADEGKEDYIVVRSEYSGVYETRAAVDLKKAIKAKYPDVFDDVIKTDFDIKNKQNDTVDVEGREILVGNTNRRQSRDLYATLSPDDYVITVSGEKLLIIGGSEYATADACDYFIATYLAEAQEDGAFRLKKDLYYKGKRKESRPPLEKGALMRYMSWNLGCGVGVESEALYVIEQYMPDLLATQESNADIYNGVINPFLKNHPEYKNAVAYHPGTTTLNYTPIIYNSNVLTLVEAKVDWLRDRYTGTNTKSVCYAVLECKTGERFAVINFHGAVCSNSYKGYEDWSSDDLSNQATIWRTGNVTQILEIRDSIVAKYGDIPITVNGDCNFNNQSSQFATVINAGFFDCEQTAVRKIKQGYKTSYNYEKGIPGIGLSIDHIFGTAGVKFLSFDSVRDSHVAAGSDHTPVYTDFDPFGKGE